jgi:hypothetical protein
MALTGLFLRFTFLVLKITFPSTSQVVTSLVENVIPGILQSLLKGIGGHLPTY